MKLDFIAYLAAHSEFPLTISSHDKVRRYKLHGMSENRELYFGMHSDYVYCCVLLLDLIDDPRRFLSSERICEWVHFMKYDAEKSEWYYQTSKGGKVNSKDLSPAMVYLAELWDKYNET